MKRSMKNITFLRNLAIVNDVDSTSIAEMSIYFAPYEAHFDANAR